jgi:TPR repeat protein
VKPFHASFRGGQQAYLVGDYAAALENFLPLARRGNAAAQYYLGRMHHEGRGLPEDNQKAYELARKAAEQGDGDAEALLGVLYAQGQGVPKDDAEAARWFHKAAQRGNASGQSKTGMCYLRGIGVPKDCVTAWMWFDLAASQITGHDQMCNCDLRDTIAALDLTAAQIGQARRMSRAWKPEEASPPKHFFHMA